MQSKQVKKFAKIVKRLIAPLEKLKSQHNQIFLEFQSERDLQCSQAILLHANPEASKQTLE